MITIILSTFLLLVFGAHEIAMDQDG